ncbi:hypothetical protein MGYG_00753 [Nannizzia gypsea CBS 118893]|uniref:Rhodopsin domain-containing protein n=1 Tax=Arthroderma gypseum (strain ATCC MYA-4604 / CBS 118893) TaxID=535722 RepID=E5R1L5_ARTGP|nr:hypothetical protein MGYG_00753 [Nannizzia gypsea CBS 118893]EFQ97713.1 hypothetical protein MGYG_00753 [Nannizzia gypsea CBS 118893]
MAGDRGLWLSTATVLFFSWAILACGVRVWIIATLHVAANFWAVDSGYGRPIVDIGDLRMHNVQKALFIGHIAYIGSTGLSRVSTAFFIGQLTRHSPRVRMSYLLASAAGGWTMISIPIVAMRGKLSQPWTVLDGGKSMFYRWIAVEVGAMVIEIALWLLSLSLIWGLQMNRQKQILILAAFGSRLLILPILSMRLSYLSPEKNYNPTFTSIVPHILMEAALNYALASTSLTSLKPLLKPFHTGAIANRIRCENSGIYSGARLEGQGIYMLTPVSRGSEGQSIQ